MSGQGLLLQGLTRGQIGISISVSMITSITTSISISINSNTSTAIGQEAVAEPVAG